VFQPDDVLKFDSAIVIKVLVNVTGAQAIPEVLANVSSPRLNNDFFLNLKYSATMNTLLS